jgi:hypothetical protein
MIPAILDDDGPVASQPITLTVMQPSPRYHNG